jgi:hypothetical protein
MESDPTLQTTLDLDQNHFQIKSINKAAYYFMVEEFWHQQIYCILRFFKEKVSRKCAGNLGLF